MRAPRPLTLTVALAVAASFVLIVTWKQLYDPSSITRFTPSLEQKSRLHLLVVATSPELNLCRLLLSASILSYPAPVLIDWNGQGEFDAAESHIAKVRGSLRYLEALPASQKDDIVLLLDGYDIVFQLGPELLLQRYFEANRAANERLISRFGRRLVAKYGIYQDIVFGADKLCWPVDDHRPACWAVPQTTLEKYAFGPRTDAEPYDMEHATPRWLNSGTIMGSAGEMKALFKATMDNFNKTYDENYEFKDSDQMYLANVWGEQEYARSRLLGDVVDGTDLTNSTDKDIPVFEKGQRTEFHIGMDYESQLFQPMAGYIDYISWIKFDQSAAPINWNQTKLEPYQLDIQPDVLASTAPYSPLEVEDVEGYAAGKLAISNLLSQSWRNVSLSVNIVTTQIFPIMHFTGDKLFRDAWWERNWFLPHAELLQRAAVKMSIGHDGISSKPMNKKLWLKDKSHKINDNGKPASEKGGAWADTEEWLPWEDHCSIHEDVLYGRVPYPEYLSPEPVPEPSPEAAEEVEQAEQLSDRPIEESQDTPAAVPESSSPAPIA